MNNKLEGEKAITEQIDKKIFEYVLLDVKKRLNREKITPDNPNFEKLLNIAIRLTLLKKKFGILKPGQPSEEKREWFNRIKEEISKSKIEKDWIIQSAQRHQWREEKRAGQTYQESDLE